MATVNRTGASTSACTNSFVEPMMNAVTTASTINGQASRSAPSFCTEDSHDDGCRAGLCLRPRVGALVVSCHKRSSPAPPPRICGQDPRTHLRQEAFNAPGGKRWECSLTNFHGLQRR